MEFGAAEEFAFDRMGSLPEAPETRLWLDRAVPRCEIMQRPSLGWLFSVSLCMGSTAACVSGGVDDPGSGSNAGSPGAGSGGGAGIPGGGSGNVAGTSMSGGGAGGSPGGGGGGVAGVGGNPVVGNPGYWVSKDWHGCSWTGKGAYGTTTVMPLDFTTKPPADPFCMSGTVGTEPEFKSVALMGFNTNEPATASCAYRPPDPTMPGPAGVMPQGTGIAVNFVKRGTNTSFTWRVQIQGPNGHLDGPAGEMDRWCANIIEPQGKVFVPYSSFTPQCWQMTPMLRGTPFSETPGKTISAVVFTVPGDSMKAIPYDFCVNGLAYGMTAADAPDGPAVGSQTGTVGGPGQDFGRAKVVVEGKEYVIQNNNWGSPETTDLLLSYNANSFTVTTGTGAPPPSDPNAPASFPSIFIGNNGFTNNGAYSTKATDGLPAQVSTITSLPTTFRYSGSTSQWNATYDIWFSNSMPQMQYNDGINGFVMVWLRDPNGRQPIGSRHASSPVTIAGQPWDVWVGPRGFGPNGNNPAPVVSFVNPAQDDNSRAQSFANVNLKLFIDAAAAHGISPSMYLTDVFAGFEIWQGGGGGNLKVDEFKAVVNK